MASRSPAPSADGRVWVWTDGSFHTDSSVGGWAWTDRHGASAHGSLADGVTSEYMELVAVRNAIEAHQALPHPLRILCDHQGIVRNLNRHPTDFRLWASGHRRSRARPEVQSILLGIGLLLRHVDVEMRWTRGHADDHLNKVVDRLSRRARVDRELHPNAVYPELRAVSGDLSAS